MELEKAIRERRSVRVYRDKKVPKKVIRNLIEFATWAPSACNYQNWHFIVVNDENVLKKLYDAGAEHVVLSPVSIFICYDFTKRNITYKDHIQSASAAIQNLLLKAYEEGLGTCWVCDLPKRKAKIKNILKIPWNYDIIAQVNLGHPKHSPKPPSRKSIEEVMSFNEFKKGKSLSRISYYKFLIKKVVKHIKNSFKTHEEFELKQRFWKY